LNRHQIPGISDSGRFGYLSDLFVAPEFWNDCDFINQFFVAVFSEIKKRFPRLEVLAGMAAAGDPNIPIVNCFNCAKESKETGLMPLDHATQIDLGVAVHFVFKPENVANTHLPPKLPRGKPSHLSIVALNAAEAAEKKRLEPSLQALRENAGFFDNTTCAVQKQAAAAPTPEQWYLVDLHKVTGIPEENRDDDTKSLGIASD
jgi:hypothetical protein